LNMQPPGAYLEQDAQPSNAQATEGGVAPALLPCMQSPVLRPGKLVFNTHQNREATLLHSSPGGSRMALAYEGGRYDDGRLIKISKLRVCPIGGRHDLRRSLVSGPSVGRQAVLILRGTYAGQLGVVDAGYMGGPKARLRPIDAEGRENRAVNIDAVNVHALADAELAFRSFELPQRDALRDIGGCGRWGWGCGRCVHGQCVDKCVDTQSRCANVA
ncbi:hypothetical protein Agub_g14379, partial [Astrephomene gubernaculifera]